MSRIDLLERYTNIPALLKSFRIKSHTRKACEKIVQIANEMDNKRLVPCWEPLGRVTK